MIMHSIDRDIFARRLKVAIGSKYIGVLPMCRENGLPRSLVTRYLAGQSAPNATNLYNLAVILDVSTDYLLGLSDEMRLKK